MITDKEIQNAKLEPKFYTLKDYDGLFLRVNPKGKKVFYFRYKWLDNPLYSIIDIGEYGVSSNKYSLTKARAKRDQFIDDIKAGINPKEESTKGATFKTLANQWLKAQEIKWSAKTRQTNVTRLGYAIKDIGAKPIEDVTAEDILNICRKQERRGTKEVARRTRAIVGSIFEYHMLYDVSARVSKSLVIHKPINHPHFTEKEDIKKLLNDIDNYHGSYEARMALKFLSYTFVPLSTQAQELLKEIQQITGDKKYIFNSNYRDNYLSDTTLGRILTRMGYGGKHSVHGFRHMASTCLNELEYDGDAIELQLSHAPVGVRGVYNKAKKLNYRTKMMQDWADWLSNL